MTANADYGVSIVESFVPPKNWLPGQEINKDVYAVNTGNIEAFVKEELSGILNYSFEYKVDTFDATCVTLDKNGVRSIDGATMNEGGAFLAWNNAGVENGYVNSARIDDNVEDTWHPTVAGDYIFRRTIGKNDLGETVYTYAGYHFEPNGDGIEDDKYYKIVIGTDPFRAAKTFAADNEDDEDGSTRFVFDISVDGDKLGDGVTIGADGLITGTSPKISYVQVENIVDADVSFAYNAGTEDKYDGAPYLAVRYNNTTGDQVSAKAKAIETAQKNLADAQKALADAEVLYGPDTDAVADAEIEYYNALYAYYTAKSRYDKTNADKIYAHDLLTAANKLSAQALKRKTAEDNKASKLADLVTAMNNLKNEIAHEYTDTDDTNFTSFNEIVTAMECYPISTVDSGTKF